MYACGRKWTWRGVSCDSSPIRWAKSYRYCTAELADEQMLQAMCPKGYGATTAEA